MEVREDNPKTLAIARARDIKREVDALRNIKTTSINADPWKDGKQTDTYIELNEQWLERQKLVAAENKARFDWEGVAYTGEEAIAKFDDIYKMAELGNLSQRELVLLREYHSITDKKKQAEFLKAHPELTAIPRQDWLKSHPKENAQLAVWGQADILTKEAYTEFKKLVKELDIPDSALPERTLPPEGSIDTHFKYLDMVAEGTHQSWEADLMLSKDPEYLKWKGLKPSDTPIASLELKVKNRANFDKLAGYSDKDSPDYIVDEKKRAEAIKKFRADNPTFVDDTRRIDAIEKGTEKAPIDPKIVDAHVAYTKLQGAPGVGSSSAEVMLYRVDNPKYDKWRQDVNVWGDNALKPVDQSRIPIWRIDVKYAKEDAAYEAIKNPLPAEQARLRDEYMASHPEYRKDAQRREAYGLTNSRTGYRFPAALVTKYVAYNELSVKGKRRDRFLVENPKFANALKAAGKLADLPNPATVPAVQYDDIYDRFQQQFDIAEWNGKPESKYFIADPKVRAAQDKELRFDKVGKLTAFGIAETRRQAYADFVPENYVDDYVGYFSIMKEGKPKGVELWFDDDRFLISHPEFYGEVYIGLLGRKEANLTRIPSKDFETTYNEQYSKLATATSRRNFRLMNLGFDAEGVDYFGWEPIKGEVKKLTPSEEMVQKTADQLARAREMLRK